VSSMPEPIHHDQDDNTASEAILGVDTHKDLHAAAVINPLGMVLSSEMFPATEAVTRSCLPGRVGWCPRTTSCAQAGTTSRAEVRPGRSCHGWVLVSNRGESVF
jgi:hypothetical protein